LHEARAALGQVQPLYINGRWVETDRRRPTRNPAREEEIIAHVCQAGEGEIEQAVEAAQTAFPQWRSTPPEQRADVLFRAADAARRQKVQLAGLQVLEVGKTRAEADADVAEAIDFLNYYAQEMIKLDRPRQLSSLPGEVNRYFYQPRGLAAVIAPWNFPLAISMGMVAAALVSGNCVLYKPSVLSAAVGASVAQLFHDAGLPPGVLAYLAGPGASVGRTLAAHPHVSMIAFTGSREVGLNIIRQGAEIGADQDHIKKVIAEMGGKNAIIVDADADLDEAVSGILKSAFGYQGQKCSACSRVIVLTENYDRLLARLIPAADALEIGDPAGPSTDIGPVISREAKQKVMRYVELGKKEGRPLLLKEGPETGSFAPLAIFDRIDPASPLAQEEIFGPLLTLIKAEDIGEALRVANGVPYALTGGFYSRSPLNIQQVMEEFRVGNLYINRGITGALVGRQPFGGFKMSGIGSKAGGPDYLLQFMEPRCTTENTLRRGFAPES
jgi:RHH-type proline utilization regulon transcriptional repressor/proline dehydrogenase/delta 1-pyrroline-5-carboxylate dehydrogenase